MLSYGPPFWHARDFGTNIGWVERDSRKDQLIVILFLIITTGLLVYAIIRPYVQTWLAVLLQSLESMTDTCRERLVTDHRALMVKVRSMKVCQHRILWANFGGMIPDTLGWKTVHIFEWQTVISGYIFRFLLPGCFDAFDDHIAVSTRLGCVPMQIHITTA